MNWGYGLAGVLIGIAIAYFGNRVVLPYVLEQQRFAEIRTLDGPKHAMSWAERMTRISYKGMYILFPVLLGIYGLFYFGTDGG
jgi:hypothetical protein